MYERSYAYTTRIAGTTVAATAERVREALAREGFGVLTEIDVQATFKKKLGVERGAYLILGACNPPIAHRALELEPSIGLFLPCNVNVFEGEDGAVYVQTPRPGPLFELVGNASVADLAEEIDGRLQRVIQGLAS